MCFIPPALLKLSLKVCVIVANVVCLKHTRSFLYYRLVQYTSWEGNFGFFLFQKKKKEEDPFFKKKRKKKAVTSNRENIDASLFSQVDVFLEMFWLRVQPKQVDLNVCLEIFLFVPEERHTQYYIWVIFFPPPRLRSDGHIAQVFMPLFMLHYFSMSWNAMFLVLLTLYSVIHFIINSLPNIFASVFIEDTLFDTLKGIRDNIKTFLRCKS